jgi:sulfatase maturation enzyme AslB (radical SAM superfamily)
MPSEQESARSNESGAALPTHRFPGFHVMVKPTGPICNLDCKYCFYLEKEKLAGGEAGHCE